MICVAIPCLPRSGSSMTAGIVDRLEFDMGLPGLRTSNRHNPRGYYEDWRFSRFHRWCSVRANADDADGFRRRLRMPPENPTFAPDQVARYRRLVAACESAGRNWGVKDPELTYYFPRLAETVTCDLRVLVPRRPAEEVVASIIATLGHAPEDAYLVVEDYDRKLGDLLTTWCGPQLVFDYHDCLRRPATVVAEIAGFLGVPVSEDAVAFVDPRLRRHRSGR